MSLDLENSLNWNLRLRQNLSGVRQSPVGYYLKPLPIPPVTVDLKSALVIVGIGSESAKQSWYKGAYASLALPFKPSSTSQFGGLTYPAIDNKICRLGFLNLLDFTEWQTSQKKLVLRFPPYIQDIYVEVWEYSESTDGVFKPASNDKYSIADDINALRFYLEGKEVPVTILNSNK